MKKLMQCGWSHVDDIIQMVIRETTFCMFCLECEADMSRGKREPSSASTPREMKLFGACHEGHCTPALIIIMY